MSLFREFLSGIRRDDGGGVFLGRWDIHGDMRCFVGGRAAVAGGGRGVAAAGRTWGGEEKRVN